MRTFLLNLHYQLDDDDDDDLVWVSRVIQSSRQDCCWCCLYCVDTDNYMWLPQHEVAEEEDSNRDCFGHCPGKKSVASSMLIDNSDCNDDSPLHVHHQLLHFLLAEMTRGTRVGSRDDQRLHVVADLLVGILM